jgi:hypothetical protein
MLIARCRALSVAALSRSASARAECLTKVAGVEKE